MSELSLDAHTVVSVLARGSLAAAGLFCAPRFARLKNTLLAYEWGILGVSASCGVMVALFPWPAIQWLWDYFDAFSRLLGVPVIATLGLMEATHRLRLTHRQEGILFAGSLIVAFLFFTLDFTTPIREPVYLVTMLGFGVYVAILIRHTFKVNKHVEAWSLTAALAFYFFITPLDHYYFLPHTDTAIVFNDDSVAHVGWASLFAAIYFAYRGIVTADSGNRNRVPLPTAAE